MVAELWKLKMGNQVSTNLGNSTNSSNKIGILSFEVANVMSKIIYLHKSLSENEISKLKNEILMSEGVRTLVSSDERKLLELAVEEKLDDLNKVSSVVSRLGKKCTVPALQGFEHVYWDIVSGNVDFKELSFLVKDMEGVVRKMDRYVSYTASLYTEMEVMNELEVATKKFQQNQHKESRKAFEQKLAWQKQDVRHLRDVSLWNQSYDKVVDLLARTVCTVYARMCVVFGDICSRRGDSSAAVCRSQVGFSGNLKWGSGQIDVGCEVQKDDASSENNGCLHAGRIVSEGVEKRTVVGSQKNVGGLFYPKDYNSNCCMGNGRLFMQCLALTSSGSRLDDDQFDFDDERTRNSGVFSASSNVKCGQQRQTKGNISKFGNKNRLLLRAPHSTLGGSALALHYANVIIVLEKFLRYPHLVGDEARDDLYHMLPTSLRKALKSSLKSYVKDLAIYDGPLAHSWRERLESMLKWLAPLAHSTMRWQSERNFEQQQIVTRKNVVLLQTLYFADRKKTEAVICEVLVGLNYICRYEQQQNALLDCESSFDFEDCLEWQTQVGASFDP